MEHKSLIQTFYNAFIAGDARGMTACYHDDITFTDPAFGTLKGARAKAMWHMLIDRANGQNKVTYSGITITQEVVFAEWTAAYKYGVKKRPVVNHVKATFTFKDGKIYTHRDDFNMYQWSKQALGLPGYLLGWTPFMRAKIQEKTNTLLNSYMSNNDLDEIT